MRRAAWLAAPLLGVTAGACSSHSLDGCDITERACQESVYYRVLSLRGDGYDPFAGLPPIAVITEAELRAELEKEAAERAAHSGPNPWDTALGLLHFSGTSAPNPDGGAPADGGSYIDDEVTHVLAYYSPDTKRVTVVSHPSQTVSAEQAMVTLAHELVHALQDRELDLSAQVNDLTLDAYLATRKGLVEGDARFYEYLFTADIVRTMGRIPREVTEMPDLELDYAYQNFDELGSPLFAAEYLMYPLGAKYFATAYRAGGNAAVRHAYARVPGQTVSFLVGVDGRAPPPGAGVVCSPPAVTNLPSGPSAAGGDQFGAVSFYTFLRGWGLGHDAAFTMAQSWTGDYLQVQANRDLSTVAVAWRLEFSQAVPASIASALGASGELTVITGNGSLEITAAASATPVVWQATAACP